MGSICRVGDRVRVRFVTGSELLEDFHAVRLRDPEALAWVLRIGAIALDHVRDQVVVEISAARYDCFLASMDNVEAHVPGAVEASLQVEFWDLYDDRDATGPDAGTMP